jgi:hypothetical protein
MLFLVDPVLFRGYKTFQMSLDDTKHVISGDLRP